MVDTLKDKALIYGEDMGLTTSGDFEVVSGYEVVLQAAQNRCLSYLETWKYDNTYGSELGQKIMGTPTGKITNAMVSTYINYALQPMVLDGRIKNIDSVSIIDRGRDSITVEIILTL